MFALIACLALPTLTAYGEAEKVSDLSNEYLRLVAIHQSALSAEDMLAFQQALGTDILYGFDNANAAEFLDFAGKDGTFGNKNEQGGFYEKQGAQIAWGLDYAVQDDITLWPLKKGDHKRVDGIADLSAGTMSEESSGERAGEVISRARYDFQFGDGSVIGLAQVMRKEDTPYNRTIFIVMSETACTFVVGNATEGSEARFVDFDPGMSVANAKTLMEGAGYTIETHCKVENGKLTLN